MKKIRNIYLLERTDDYPDDVIFEAVVIAEDENSARHMLDDYAPYQWTENHNDIKVTHIGVALDDYETEYKNDIVSVSEV